MKMKVWALGILCFVGYPCVSHATLIGDTVTYATAVGFNCNPLGGGSCTATVASGGSPEFFFAGPNVFTLNIEASSIIMQAHTFANFGDPTATPTFTFSDLDWVNELGRVINYFY